MCIYYGKYAIKYAKYVNLQTISKICKICTPNLADDLQVTASQWPPGMPVMQILPVVRNFRLRVMST